MIQRLDPRELTRMQAQAEIEGRQCVVGAVIINEQRRAFVQKRAADRRLFPGCWDVIGGHVEAGETLEVALSREIREETGWELKTIMQVISIFDWEDAREGKLREVDFLVQIMGNLEQPQLEWSKVTEFRWLGLHELDILQESRRPEDTFIYNIVKKALEENEKRLQLDALE